MASDELAEVEIRWDVRVPMRDDVTLSATLYRPEASAPNAVIFALTPYVADHLHDRGMYFAARGLPFVAVDCRGRGNSNGEFWPYRTDAQDGYDVVKWLVSQPFCNGQVAMYGGSYFGYTQWVIAAEQPQGLRTIVPTAAPFIGLDVPMPKNIFSPYFLRWLSIVGGRTAQPKLFADERFWTSRYRKWLESGLSFRDAGRVIGLPSAIFQEWLDHPSPDSYWESKNPSTEQYRRLEIPVLTITGIYDGDQLGALEHYRRHIAHASPETRKLHYLVIGPWNHAGCGAPVAEFDGLKIDRAGVIDMFRLHYEWYRWVLQGRAKPTLLKRNVAYYVTGAERWQYADDLQAVTVGTQTLYFYSKSNPTDIYASGALRSTPPEQSGPDHFRYDPLDTSLATLETTLEVSDRTDQRLLHAAIGHHLIYHSAPFDQDTEISGFFKLNAWISLDQLDTDLRARVYEIDRQGRSVELTSDYVRARYRGGLYAERLVEPNAVTEYEFSGFPFVSRLIRKGCRLRLVLGPSNSIHDERNFNSGGVVADEAHRDARVVTVTLFHDQNYPSALFIPIGAGPAADEGGESDCSPSQ